MMAVCVIDGKAAVTSGESGKTEGRREESGLLEPIWRVMVRQLARTRSFTFHPAQENRYGVPVVTATAF